MADNRPNPLNKAAESSHLPLRARARIGQTTDPVPQGKVAHTEPEHHFPIEPASHDVERTTPKTAQELGVEPHELERLHRLENRQHVDLKSDLQSGMDYMGSSTQANKKMPSTQRRADTYGHLSKGGGK
jgi:hypothetical protein